MPAGELDNVVLLAAVKLARVRPSVARLAATFAVALVVSAVSLLSRFPHQMLTSIGVPSPSGQAVLGFVGLAVLIALSATASFRIDGGGCRGCSQRSA